ncbi:T9SS sorting signal type C domain-containing protein [Flavobacterium aestivum]|uniref:T9SS sorting signal type C domain-containing protein n=1 Tax=Flavobacterium aestivum TaxID=3003257 RepID=UPI0022865410|nr:T9SS sorting signal type C domain-containing protein [Flavobacterium aestivum]
MRLKLSLLLVFIFSLVRAQPPHTFSSSGTLNVPAGVTSATVQAWGGGGAGGGASGGSVVTGRGGAGGGGGAYASATITVTPGSVLSVVVAGQTAGTTGTGSAGGSSTITGFESSILAAGGSGGTANTAGGTPAGGAGGTTAASFGTTKLAGGNGGNGQTALLTVGLTSGAGGDGGNSGGAGGVGRQSLIFGQGPGNDGTAPGGGGSGAIDSGGASETGGAGGAGQVIIFYTCPTYSLSGATATDVCAATGTTSVVTLTSSAASLPVGNYVVTYDRSSPSATGLTATMTVSVAGTGTFTAVGLNTVGSSTITVTKLTSEACFSNISTNNVATVIISPASVGGTVSGGTSICSGNTSSLLTLTGYTGGIVKWQYAVSPFSSWTDIANTAATYTSGVLTATTQFRAVVQSGVCATANSATTTVTVNALPTISTTGNANDVCFSASAQTATLSYNATTNSPISYSIVWNAAAHTAGLSDQGSTSFAFLAGGGNVNTIALPASLAANTYSGTMTIVNANCSTTQSVQVTVKPKPTAPVPVAVTDPTCIVSTGSATLSGLPTSITWLITQSGTASTTYSNIGATYLVSNLAPGTYTFTVEYAGSCVSPSSTSVVVNAVVSNTWNGVVWSKTGNTTPPATSTDIVIFDGNYSSSDNISGCSCQVKSGKSVTIQSGGIMTMTDAVVNNGGTLIFENNSSLVQLNNSAVNTGSITYKRNASPMKNFDYTYWSSPVVGQKLNVLSPNTLSDKYFSFANNAWKIEPGVTQMEIGKGYIIRTPKDNGGTPWPNGEVVSFPYAQLVQFVGVPNNGVYSLSIGTTDGDGNLIGNPYPSAMSADYFLAANNKEIDGTIYFWTHNTAISNLTYSSTDYASYNGVGGVNTLPAASGGATPSGNIAAGQSFFTVTKKGVGFTGSVTFNNSMRVGVANSNAQFFKGTKSKEAIVKHRVWLNLSNDNGAFKQTLVGYVTGATVGNDAAFDGESFDGNKYIDFYSINDSKNLAIQGRALPFDKTDKVPLGYKTTIEGTFAISIDKVDGVLANQAVFIEDKVTNVIHNLKNGAYSFSTQKGVFNDRFVLRYTDNSIVVTDPVVTDPIIVDPIETNPVVENPVVTDPVVQDPVVQDPIVMTPVITDPIVQDPIVSNPVVKDPVVADPIVTVPIVLDPNKGSGTLGTDDFANKGKSVIVFVKDHQIKINSFDETIGKIMVYDLRGRLLYEKANINNSEFVVQNLASAEQVLIVKVQLKNDKWVVNQIILRA